MNGQDGHSMFDRPWSEEEQARLDATPPPPNQWRPGDLFVGVWDIALSRYENWTADDKGNPIDKVVPEPEPYEPPKPVVVAASGGPGITVARRGPSTWIIDCGLAQFTCRNVVTHRDMSADITVVSGSMRLLRTSTTLSLAGRNSFTKALVSRASGVGTPDLWSRAVDIAFEALLDEQERACRTTSLRDAPTPSMEQEFTVWPLVPSSVSMLVAPGETGKSTLLRALAVSIATGKEIIPGFKPLVTGPTLYVASEDPKERAHVRSIEAICRGAGIDRPSMDADIVLLSSTGKPLHRVNAQIAEMAPDFAFVGVDAMQGFLSIGEDVRNSAQLFWDAIDDIDAQALCVAGHPNLSNAREWGESDGRAAGAEVSRDRVRMQWKVVTRDVPSVVGAEHSVITLVNTKNNDGPKFREAFSFGRTWSPGALTFSAVTSVPVRSLPKPTKAQQEIIDAWDSGHRTPGAMKANVPSLAEVPYDTLKSRIRTAKDAGYVAEDG